MMQGQLPENIQDDLARAGPLEAIALYDGCSPNTRVRAQRQGALSEGARVRRARPHRRGHGDHGAPDRGQSAFGAFRRSAVQARRVLLHAPEVPRRRGRLSGDHPGPPPRTTSSRSTSSVGRSTSRSSTKRRCTSTWRCSTTRCRSATTSISARRGRRRRVTDTFRVISLSFTNLGARRPSGVLLDNGQARLRGPRLQQSRRALSRGSCATTTRRRRTRRSSRCIRSTAPRRTSACAWSRSTTGRVPKLVLESKREFASKYGLQAEYWQHYTPEESPEVLSYLKTNLRTSPRTITPSIRTKKRGERRSRTTARPPLVRRLPRVVPEGRRFAADQLPARGPAAREQGLRRGGEQYERTAYEYARTPSRLPPATPRSTRIASS